MDKKGRRRVLAHVEGKDTMVTIPSTLIWDGPQQMLIYDEVYSARSGDNLIIEQWAQCLHGRPLQEECNACAEETRTA